MNDVTSLRLTLGCQRSWTSYPVSVWWGRCSTPKEPQCLTDEPAVCKWPTTDDIRHPWRRHVQSSELPEENRAESWEIHRKFNRIFTLYAALLILTNRPLLVNVHFKRSMMSRCIKGLQSAGFEHLATSKADVLRPFNASRSSSWSHAWVYSQICWPIKSIWNLNFHNFSFSRQNFLPLPDPKYQQCPLKRKWFRLHRSTRAKNRPKLSEQVFLHRRISIKFAFPRLLNLFRQHFYLYQVNPSFQSLGLKYI